LPAAIVIRAAGAGDVPALVALLNAAFAMEREFVDRDRTSAAEIAQLMQSGRFLVADNLGGALAACAYVELHGRRTYMGMLAVDPSLQRRGLGRRMIAAVENCARESGCSGIDIKIVDRRVELPPLYRALGFRDNGTAPFDDRLLTKPCHFLLMSKELAP
jgi:N-acetylglutamate synthase-like GNAT family acetyltransferase